MRFLKQHNIIVCNSGQITLEILPSCKGIQLCYLYMQVVCIYFCLSFTATYYNGFIYAESMYCSYLC